MLKLCITNLERKSKESILKSKPFKSIVEDVGHGLELQTKFAYN